MMRRINIIFFLIPLCLYPLSYSSAGQPVTFAVYELGYLYNEATSSGIDKDIASELARRSGREFRLVYMSRARIWKEIEQGTLMMTGSGIENSERSAFAHFVPCMAMKNYVITDKNQQIRGISHIGSHPDLKFGVIRSYKHGSSADAALDDLRKQGKVFEVTEQQQLYRMLKAGRISAFMALPTSSGFYLKQMQMSSTVETANWFPKDPPVIHNIVFSKKAFTVKEMEQWRKIIREMRDDGTLEKIYAGYVGRQYAAEMLRDLR